MFYRKIVLYLLEFLNFYKYLFDNHRNLEFNKINILKQGVLTPCIDKKNLGYRTYLLSK